MSIEKIIQNRQWYTFWVLNFLFWFAHLAFFSVVNYPRQYYDGWLTIYLLFYLSSFFNSVLIRYVFKYFRIHEFSFVSSAIVIVLFGIFCGHLSEFEARWITKLILANDYNMITNDLYLFYRSIWYKTYPYITFGVLYVLIKIKINLSNQQEEMTKTALLGKEAQLNLLRYQLNPHFLFNVLNSIRALVRDKKQETEEIISELSEFLKYSLFTRNKEFVSLSEEIEMLEHYLRIEKIRFEHKLSIHIDIDPLAEEYPIPPLLLQPLIENAIKYGNHLNKTLYIRIFASVKDDILIIDVVNSGSLHNDNKENRKNGKQTTGTGLENIRSRMELAYPDYHTLTIKQVREFVEVHLEMKKELRDVTE